MASRPKKIRRLLHPVSYLRWKIRKTFRPRLILIGGTRVETAPERLGIESVRALYWGTYEASVRKVVRKAVERGDRVLDIGAGIGLTSILCAKRCGAGAVLSYEPNPANAPLIQRNFELNGLKPQLKVRALAPSKGSCTLFVTPDGVSSSVFDRGVGEGVEVETDGIGEVIAEFHPTCLIVDAMGAEVEILPEAPLNGVRKIIVENHPAIVGEAAIDALASHLEAQGFVLQTQASRDNVRLYLRKV